MHIQFEHVKLNYLNLFNNFRISKIILYKNHALARVLPNIFDKNTKTFKEVKGYEKVVSFSNGFRFDS